MKAITFVGVVAVAIAIGLFVAASTSAGPKSTLGRSWAASERVPLDQIDHAAWSRLLAKYVDAEGFVDYESWKASSEDRQSLLRYLASLSRANLDQASSVEHQLAFWINAYNAVTIEGILRVYPTSSIRDHTSLLGYNIWKDLLLQVGDDRYSLHQMEHAVLRSLNEPRIHFAIVCASIGCPRLLDEAYTAKRIDQQLTRNSKQFFADTKRFNYSSADAELHLSPILKWFADDFGGTQQERLAAIASFLPDQASRRLAGSGSARVRYLDYDWSLNDQSQRR